MSIADVTGRSVRPDPLALVTSDVIEAFAMRHPWFPQVDPRPA
jgi:hypothetical protein